VLTFRAGDLLRGNENQPGNRLATVSVGPAMSNTCKRNQQPGRSGTSTGATLCPKGKPNSDVAERKRLEAAAEQDHEQIRALALRLLSAQEDERRRVSRVIHDDICQELAALTFDFGELLSEPLREASRSRLQELQSRLSKLSAAVRHVAHQLRPSALEDLGLVASVRSLCEELPRRNGMVVKFTKRKVPDRLPVEVMTCLYRIAQEGLRNAAKHSGAKHVIVRLAVNKDQITLAIRDDGSGFDVRSVRKGGLGLASMEERIRLVHGDLSIESAPGHGTSIRAAVPLPRTG
jgi:signal transduction histidine kinase